MSLQQVAKTGCQTNPTGRNVGNPLAFDSNGERFGKVDEGGIDVMMSAISRSVAWSSGSAVQ